MVALNTSKERFMLLGETVCITTYLILTILGFLLCSRTTCDILVVS